MRVISGKFRGKRLYSPADNRVRSTTDRIKETMFNILFSKGAQYNSVLDLFSGSGALGIEALSRGAKTAVFIDKDADSVKLTGLNLRNVQAVNYEIYNTDYSIALKKLKGRKFEIIFVDPPYKLKIEPLVLQGIKDNELLSEDGIIVVEHSAENKLQIDDKRYIIDERLCGNTVLSFICYRREAIE